MPKTPVDKMREMRVKYDAAYAAHKAFAMAIAELAMSGERPPDLLQDSEKQAARELAAVTDELRAAMAEVAAAPPSDSTPKAGSASG